MSLYNRKGWQRKKQHFLRPEQYAIVCERKCKEYQGRAFVVSTDSRPEAKPNMRQLLYLTFIRYSQEVHELNPLWQATYFYLPINPISKIMEQI